MPNVIHSVYGDLKTVRFVEFYRPTAGGNWVYEIFRFTLPDGYQSYIIRRYKVTFRARNLYTFVSVCVAVFFFFGTAARGTLQDVKRERPTSRFAAV